MGYSYRQLEKKMREQDKLINEAIFQKHGYDESIHMLTHTAELSRLTVLYLKKCKKDGTPFHEFELTLRKNLEEIKEGEFEEE